MRLTFTLPAWLYWLIPARVYRDIVRRSTLTGAASREIRSGDVCSVTLTAHTDK